MSEHDMDSDELRGHYLNAQQCVTVRRVPGERPTSTLHEWTCSCGDRSASYTLGALRSFLSAKAHSKWQHDGLARVHGSLT